MASAASNKSKTIRIGTINVLASSFTGWNTIGGQKQQETGLQKKARIFQSLSALDKLKLDIVCVQEVEPDWIEMLTKELPMYVCRYVQRTFPSTSDRKGTTKPDGSLVMWNRETFLQVANTEFQFETLLSPKDPRCGVAVWLNHLETKTDLIVSSVHLEGMPTATTVRAAQVKETLNEMNRVYMSTTPNAWKMILAGDFNDSMDHATLTKPIADAGLSPIDFKTHGSTAAGQMIDHVFVSDLKAVSETHVYPASFKPAASGPASLEALVVGHKPKYPTLSTPFEDDSWFSDHKFLWFTLAL